MEKRLYKAPDTILCTCGNQLLVMPGCTCDLCMGLAAEPGEWMHPKPAERHDQFDQSYFEALERLFESFDFAA